MLISSVPAQSHHEKALNGRVQREEAKTPEKQTVSRLSAAENTGFAEVKSEVRSSKLSERAYRVKQNLKKCEEITAVLLTADGNCAEIQCNPSSKEINAIIGGHPTIMGEFEEIGVIIIRSLNGNSKERNKNVLPPPLCNKQFFGNYLLFGVDAMGNAENLSLKQYQQFVEKNKLLTKQMRENHNRFDNREIKGSQSIFHSELTLVYLRSEIDKKMRAEFKDKNGRNPKYSFEIRAIDDCVNKTLRNVINSLVLDSSNNRMSDPDYNPNENENETRSPDRPGSDWRLELNEALKYVREKGRFDACVLAQKISETFNESHGIVPTLNELIEIFTEIKSKLLANKDTDAFNTVANNLVYKSKSRFIIDNGRVPTKKELKQSVQALAKQLFDSKMPLFDLKMLKTPIIKSKTGIAATYSVYFDTLNQARKAKNLLAAIESFKMRNQREPTTFEIEKLKMFLQRNDQKTSCVKFELCVIDEKESEEKDSEPSKDYQQKLLISPIKKKQSSSQYNVYFESDKFDESANQRQAIMWFEKFNGKEPTNEQLHMIKRFVKSDKREQLIEYKCNISMEETPNVRNTINNYNTDHIVNKKSGTKYILNFDDAQSQMLGSRKEATKWFKRFNNREPTDAEQQKIKEFVENDITHDIVDID